MTQTRSPKHARLVQEDDMPDGVFLRWIICFTGSLGGLFVLLSSPTLVWTEWFATLLINNHISAAWTVGWLLGIDGVAGLFAWIFAAPLGDWLALKIFKLDMSPWNEPSVKVESRK